MKKIKILNVLLPICFTFIALLSCNDNDNEHGVMGGYNVTGKWSGMGIPFSKNDNIEEIKVIIEKYLIIPKAKQMSLF